MSDIVDGYFKIYDYTTNVEPTEFNKPPFDLNYDVLGLFKERNFDKGELFEVNYWGSYDPSGKTYSDLVIKELRTYFRENELVVRREMDIVWYYDSGLSGATKHTTKIYTPEESLESGVRRRRQVIANVKITTLGLIQAVSGISIIEAEVAAKPFLNMYALEISQYIEGDEQPLKDILLNSTAFTWLDDVINAQGTRIRDYLYEQSNIDYTVNNIYT